MFCSHYSMCTSSLELSNLHRLQKVIVSKTDIVVLRKIIIILQNDSACMHCTLKSSLVTTLLRWHRNTARIQLFAHALIIDAPIIYGHPRYRHGATIDYHSLSD